MIGKHETEKVIEVKPNIIFSSFACSGASAVDVVLGSLLPSIGYYVTPFGIEGSPMICEKIPGVCDPFYHFTHALPTLFKSILERSDYRFLYQI